MRPPTKTVASTPSRLNLPVPAWPSITISPSVDDGGPHSSALYAVRFWIRGSSRVVTPSGTIADAALNPFSVDDGRNVSDQPASPGVTPGTQGTVPAVAVQ